MYRALAAEGKPVLGLVLMRNMALNDPKMAAGALVLGSFDTSPGGLQELLEVATCMESLRQKGDETSRICVDCHGTAQNEVTGTLPSAA